MEWTDFTTCSKVKALLSQEYVHVALYALSIVFLVPAIIIFFSYKYVRERADDSLSSIRLAFVYAGK